MINTGSPVIDALSIVDDAWNELRRTPFVQQQLGVQLTQIPDLSRAEAQRRSAVGDSLLERLKTIDSSKLPNDLALSIRAVHFRARSWSRESTWYGTVVDPCGGGFFGLFLPTGYCGGLLLEGLNSQLDNYAFGESGDADEYLALVTDYARLIDQIVGRTAEQASCGMRMPKAQVRQARALLTQSKTSLLAILCAAPQRAIMIGKAEYLREIESRFADFIEPAFNRALRCLLDDKYLEMAPDAVGASQYPDGAQIYAELVKFHTTLDLTPLQVHAYGYDRLADIQRQKDAIRKELNYEGDDTGFIAHLNGDARWRASTMEDVVDVFNRYINRIKPKLKDVFSVMPKAPYGVKPLSEALQKSMTYGYFDPPSAIQPEGHYRFNASNLKQHGLFTLGALTYHELVPGHHLQLALQYENESLHPFRQYNCVTAYNEGWAEYAATLAGEMGMYEEPQERYGRLLTDGFFTSRLIVDTGMNALGWSLPQARDYMRKNSGLSEAEIQTESVRYSCDIPGQDWPTRWAI